MSRATQVLAIYTELRRVAGPTLAAKDALRLAHLIVRAHYAPDSAGEEWGTPGKLRSLGVLPLDEALADGGWAVLDYEARRGFVFEDGVAFDMESLQEWLRATPDLR